MIKNINQLSKSKARCRKYRKKILEISQSVSALHIGGSCSSVEIIDCIYNRIKKNKDKFILSKGHAGILQYVVLNDLGIIKNKDLKNYQKKNGFLGVHPDYGTPGIMASTGSLGHGLAMAAGMALACKNKNRYFYILLSDGELQEGSVWESVLTISSLKLNNIIVVVDNNNLQTSSWTTDTHPTLYPIDKKFESFGWNAAKCNGHNSNDIFNKIKKKSPKKPLALIAKTIKGYPISFMKNVPEWHYRAPNKVEYFKAIKEIDNL
jgi:transketolase